nr:uncharacterized protein LOC127307872 [Lolium perenne]
MTTMFFPNADAWHRRPSSRVVCGGLGAVPPLCSPWSSSFNLDKLGVVERVRTRCYLTHNTGKAKLINLMWLIGGRRFNPYLMVADRELQYCIHHDSMEHVRFLFLAYPTASSPQMTK